MKKISVFLLVALTAIATANAQFTMVGGGLDFTSGYHFHNVDYVGNKSGMAALTFKGIYKINVPIRISPTLTFLVPHVYTGEVNMKETVNTIMIDINGNYVFNTLDKFEFYGIAGFDILLGWNKTKYSGTGAATYKESDNALGLNVGAGSCMKLTDQFSLYLEAKYLVSKYDQFMLNAGVLINIDWLKKNENTGIN
jgi:hypothetical protein